MKKLFGLLCLASIVLVFSCTKESSTKEEPEMTVKTKTWLMAFKEKAPQKTRKDRIDEILSGLKTGSFVEERVNDQEYLTVFPISGTFLSTTAQEKKHQDFLLVVSDNERKILSAKVGRFVSQNAGTQIEAQSFIDFYNKQNPGFDGIYYFLTLAGNHLYNFTFKDGSRTSFGLVTNKNEGSEQRSRIATRCNAYYLVTTYYYPDGSTFQTREYLYTICDSIDPQVPQGDEGGGGVGGGGVDVHLDNVVKQVSWVVAIANNQSWVVKSYERLKGVRDSVPSPYGGHFTSIDHLNSVITGIEEVSWQEVAVTTSLTLSNFAATSQVAGTLTYSWSGVSEPALGTAGWVFKQVFP
jgi:hypothetical protein